MITSYTSDSGMDRGYHAGTTASSCGFYISAPNKMLCALIFYPHHASAVTSNFLARYNIIYLNINTNTKMHSRISP